MVFKKDISDLTFSDIESLQTDKIAESHMLDYKQELIDDKDLLRHVAAFANTGGGYIVFGVKESGMGGHPESIPGIDASAINKERMEQIILGNILPRIHVRMNTIEHREGGKQVLVMQIPDSQYKPHYSSKTNKFYKRFEFEAACMTEQEVSDAYKSRFHATEEVEGYLDSIEDILGDETNILGEIIVIPSSIDRRMIDTDDYERFEWLRPRTVNPEPSGWNYAASHSFVPGLPEPLSDGIECRRETDGTGLKLHRNGCIHYSVDCGQEYADEIWLHDRLLAVRILHTLKFAVLTLLRYNYFGDVRIRVRLRSRHKHVEIWRNSEPSPGALGKFKQDRGIQVDRELSTGYLESNPCRITASIMNEVFNSFGIWRCPLFDENGDIKMDEFLII